MPFATGSNRALSRQRFFVCAALIVCFAATFLFLFHRQEPTTWRDVIFISKSLGPEQASDAGGECEQFFDRTFETLISAYRRCLLEKLEGKDAWTELHVAVTACIGGALWKILDVRYLENHDDVKLVILPAQIDADATSANATASTASAFDCIEVTLGVGDDIEAERRLRELVPFCRFFGADPILDSGKIFRELGAYFELAVGWRAGNLTASVLENGVYSYKIVPTVTLADFLVNYVKADHVDFLWLDNEGPEYGIFEQFQPGGVLETSNVSVCQISVEMHGPLAFYQMDKKFNGLITATINITEFLPFWSSAPINHQRSYYVNIRDKYCVDTYFKNKFCGRESNQF